MKNKKFICIASGIIILAVIVVGIVIASGRKNRDDNVTGENKSTVAEETANNSQTSEQIETETDKNGEVVTKSSSEGDEKGSDANSSKNGKSDDKKSSNKPNNNGVNVMDDIFTDEAIENATTKKKNNQKPTDKNGDVVETKPVDANNDDGWSDFY